MATRSFRVAYGLAAVGAVTLALHFFIPVNPTTAGFAYLITVLIVAAQWGLLESISASIAAAFGFNYFFLPPLGTLAIADPHNWVSLAAFVIASLIASQLSEVARRNQELATHAEAARQSEEFKSTLLDGVAHEFKTPLTSIRAATSAILTSESLTADQRLELLTIIDQESERLTALVTEAIHLARVESGKLHLSKEPHDVPDLVRDALKQSSMTMNGRRIHTDYPSQLPRIHVDFELFIFVLKQLLDNAAKYAPPDTPIQISADASQDSVWIRVRNQGPGIAEAERTMIFERFYRAPATRKTVAGTGLGLPIAQDIVRAHGGFINVESGPGLGAEFSIRIPLLKGDRS